MGHFGSKNDTFSEILIHRNNVLKIFDDERGQEVHENNVNNFSQKILLRVKWAILGPKMTYHHNYI